MYVNTIFQAKYAFFHKKRFENRYFWFKIWWFFMKIPIFSVENNTQCRAKSGSFFCRICKCPILQMHVSLAILCLEVQWCYFWNLWDQKRKKVLRFFSHISSVWGDIEYFRDDRFFDTFLTENEPLKSASCEFSTRDTLILWGRV